MSTPISQFITPPPPLPLSPLGFQMKEKSTENMQWCRGLYNFACRTEYGGKDLCFLNSNSLHRFRRKNISPGTLRNLFHSIMVVIWTLTDCILASGSVPRYHPKSTVLDLHGWSRAPLFISNFIGNLDPLAQSMVRGCTGVSYWVSGKFC